MNANDLQHGAVSRVLLIELGGGTCDVLGAMAEAGVMPNAARLMRSAAVSPLCWDGPAHAAAMWATVQTGAGPEVHGLLDDQYLDHRRRRLVLSDRRRLPCLRLGELVRRDDPSSSVVELADLPAGTAIWKHKPTDFQQLARGIAQGQAAVRRVAAAADEADRSIEWRLMEVRLNLLDCLLPHLWHLLGLGHAPGGNRRWIAKAHEAFRTLDHALGQLLELAQRRQAAQVLVSPYGFVPYREKITLSELLCRRGLLSTAHGLSAAKYRIARAAWKVRRGLMAPACHPIGMLLPIDWRRTRAITFHGQSAAMVYLNTRERFGGRAITTPQQRDQAAAETVEALREARHPVTQTPLLQDVYETSERFGCDPLDRFLPDVIGIPAPGLGTRHRLDRNGHLLRPVRSLTATHGGTGSLMIRAPGVRPGPSASAALTDVAPTVLGLLGLAAGRIPCPHCCPRAAAPR